MTEAEARILEDLAEMRETDRIGYQAILQDLADGEPETDPAHAHAEELLGIFAARNQGHEQLIEMLNDAHLASLDADGEQE